MKKPKAECLGSGWSVGSKYHASLYKVHGAKYAPSGYLIRLNIENAKTGEVAQMCFGKNMEDLAKLTMREILFRNRVPKTQNLIWR
jgi:hypothetical protein